MLTRINHAKKYSPKKKCLSQATDDLEIEFCQKRLKKKTWRQKRLVLWGSVKKTKTGFVITEPNRLYHCSM